MSAIDHTAYADAMAHADHLYADIVGALTAEGVFAYVTQTGGMCLAVEVELRDGWRALITDDEGPLPWERLDDDDNIVRFHMGIYGGDSGHRSACEGYQIESGYDMGRGDPDAQRFASEVAPLLKILGASAP